VGPLSFSHELKSVLEPIIDEEEVQHLAKIIVLYKTQLPIIYYERMQME
jgi:hypothetical protein